MKSQHFTFRRIYASITLSLILFSSCKADLPVEQSAEFKPDWKEFADLSLRNGYYPRIDIRYEFESDSTDYKSAIKYYEHAQTNPLDKMIYPFKNLYDISDSIFIFRLRHDTIHYGFESATFNILQLVKNESLVKIQYVQSIYSKEDSFKLIKTQDVHGSIEDFYHIDSLFKASQFWNLTQVPNCRINSHIIHYWGAQATNPGNTCIGSIKYHKFGNDGPMPSQFSQIWAYLEKRLHKNPI